MKRIGVRILKSKLSEYLRLVKAGETILVTERDQVVAELRPARRQAPGTLSLDDYLETLADRKEARLRTEEPRTWGGMPKLRASGISSEALLNPLREDRPLTGDA